MHVILLEPRFNACAWTQMQEYLLRRRGRFRRVSSVLVFQGTCRSVFHCVLVFDPLRRPNLTDLPKQTESSTAGRRYIPGCARNRRWCHIRHVSKDTRRHQRNILFMTDQVRFRDARAVYEWIVIELNERNNKNTSHHNKITWNQNSTGKVCTCPMPSTRSHQSPLQRNSHQTAPLGLHYWVNQLEPRTW